MGQHSHVCHMTCIIILFPVNSVLLHDQKVKTSACIAKYSMDLQPPLGGGREDRVGKGGLKK